MSLAVVGLSHHTAPVEVRERFVFAPRQAGPALIRLTADGAVAGAVLLSTCNRTEVYLATGTGAEAGSGSGPASASRSGERSGSGVEKPDADGDADVEGGAGLAAARAAAASMLAEHAGVERDDVERHLYMERGRDAARHLFRVVSSLDSMVVGEAQIQGQVKDAYEAAAALREDVVGPVLARLFQSALSVGGRVRSETSLGIGAASIPSAAVELARKIFGPLGSRRALVLGAGEMSALALECFAAEDVDGVVVANRTAERAETLASRVGGRAVGFEQLGARLAETEILIAATAAPRPVLTRELIDRALPRGPRQPLLIVDIALPRDVEPSVGEIERIFLYDIDDLQQIVDGNLERRRGEVPRAERIISDAVADFWDWYRARDVAPVIRKMRGRAESLRRTEVEKALRRLDHLEPDDREAVELLTRQLLNKVLHDPTVRLRKAASNGRGGSVVDAARYLFALDEDEAQEAGDV